MSSLLVGVLLTIASGDLQSFELEIELASSATVALEWDQARIDRSADRVHRFFALPASPDRGLEYAVHVAGEPPRRFRVAPLAAAGPRRVALYLPGADADAGHELILDRALGHRPVLLVLGPEALAAVRGRVLGNVPIWSPGRGSAPDRLTLPQLELAVSRHPRGPAELDLRVSPAGRLRLPLASSVYTRPGSGPVIRFETPHHFELELDGRSGRLEATALEGARLDRVELAAISDPPRGARWTRGFGVALAAGSFFFAVLSLVLRRQIL